MLAPETGALSFRDRNHEQLLRQIEAGTIRCGVVGLGFIGSVLMDALLAAGIIARGYDRASSAVTRFSQHSQTLTSTTRALCSYDDDPHVLLDCAVIFVAVRSLVNDGQTDNEPLQAATRLIRAHRRPCLVILESTVTPGTTRRFAEQLDSSTDDGLFIAHAPERLSAGQDHTNLRSTPHLVAGLDAMSTQLASAMLAKICDRVIPVATPEVSELSKLLENAFLSVNIALTAEITHLCLGLGIRANDVCVAAATKPHGFMPFYPGPGLGGHCLPNDLVLLAETARTQGWAPQLIDGAISANEEAPNLVIERLTRLLADKNLALHDSELLIVGIGFKANSPDTTQSPAIQIVRRLRRLGAIVSYVDRWNAEFKVDAKAVPRVLADHVGPRQYAAGIILSGDDSLSQCSLLDACTVVLDAGGSRSANSTITAIETL